MVGIEHKDGYTVWGAAALKQHQDRTRSLYVVRDHHVVATPQKSTNVVLDVARMPVAISFNLGVKALGLARNVLR